MHAHSFGPELRRLRQDQGLQQTDLAAAAGITRSFLSAVESGKALPPSEPRIKAMAEVLGAPEDDLMALAGRLPNELTQALLRHPDVWPQVRELVR